MKKIFLIVCVVLLSVLANAQNDIVVDPNASARQVDSEFNQIDISNGIDLFLSQSDNIAIAVSAADETIKAGIKTIVKDGILKIYFDGDKSYKKRKRKLRAYVSFTELKKIIASGACDVIVIGNLTGDVLEMKLSGSSDFNGMVKLNTLKINLSGSSDAWISGKAETIDIESSGASDVHGFDLGSDFCSVNISGASDVEITVNKILKAQASGASNVRYKGDAEVKIKQSSGASDISKKS